jgi:hypothetical protein
MTGLPWARLASMWMILKSKGDLLVVMGEKKMLKNLDDHETLED